MQAVRDKPAPFWAMESLLREYPISSAEGLALMRLAEALLRVPDAETAIALTADQLGRADFDGAHGERPAQDAGQPVGQRDRAVQEASCPRATHPPGLLQRLGAQTVVAATVRAIQLLGRQFVLGRRIGEAMGEAAGAAQARQAGLRFSYDMLGEGARTERDAQRYLASYRARDRRDRRGRGAGVGPEAADGISIKLSALFSRYEDAQRERVFAELLPRVWQLIDAGRARRHQPDHRRRGERPARALARRVRRAGRAHRAALPAVARLRPGGAGLPDARARRCVDEVARIARAHGLRFMVRLVKGAYWDGEIKRAQELGLAGYPVFTHKHHTDISYLACARR